MTTDTKAEEKAKTRGVRFEDDDGVMQELTTEDPKLLAQLRNIFEKKQEEVHAKGREA